MLSVTIACDRLSSALVASSEEQDLRLVDDGARDHEALALPARQRAAAFRHVGVHAHRHRLDVLGQARALGRPPRVLDGLRADADDVPVDFRRHQLALLHDDAHLLADHAEIELADVLAVERDAAARRHFEPEHQTHERRLAAARSADERDELARLDRQRQVVDDPGPSGV
jgi:hypothetical protein